MAVEASYGLDFSLCRLHEPELLHESVMVKPFTEWLIRSLSSKSTFFGVSDPAAQFRKAELRLLPVDIKPESMT